MTCMSSPTRRQPPHEASVGLAIVVFKRTEFLGTGGQRPPAFSVSRIHDQKRKRGVLGGANLGGRHHKATPQALIVF